MSHEWDWPPSHRRGRYYTKLELNTNVPPKSPARRAGWVTSGKIAMAFVKVIIAIPLTALLIAAVFFLYLLFTLPGHSETLKFGHMQPLRVDGPSFNCNYSRTPDEVAICQSPFLSLADVRMARDYFAIHNQVYGELRWRLEGSQKIWLALRRECGSDGECLRRTYDDRIDQLERGEYIYGD